MLVTKFEPLTRYLGSLSARERRMCFREVEQVLGFQLPPSARKHRPWWSNNPDNSAMTRAWLAAGFRTERVDMAGETLVFRKVDALPSPSKPASGARLHGGKAPGSPFGGLRGTVRIVGGFDPAESTGEVWAADQRRL